MPRVLALRGASLSRWLKQDQAGVFIVSVSVRILAPLTQGSTLDNLSLDNLLNGAESLRKISKETRLIYVFIILLPLDSAYDNVSLIFRRNCTRGFKVARTSVPVQR